MGTSDLPDMYAQSPRAEAILVRQITSAHVTSEMYHFQHSKIVQLNTLPIYITMDSCIYGKFIFDISMMFIYTMHCNS